MSPIHQRNLFIAILMLLPCGIIGLILTQSPSARLQAQTSIGYIQITLEPQSASGDFYVDGTLAAQAQNSSLLAVAPDTEHILEIKNIQSRESGFGSLFNYFDVSPTLTVKAEETRVEVVKLSRNYIRGALSFTCEIRNATPADAVSCHVIVDGAAQPDIAAGQTVNYILDAGNRSVLVEIVGSQAGLFDPPSKQHSVKITLGKTTNLKVTFVKKGHLLLSLDQPGVVADFFVDGIQSATQVAAIDMWVASGVSHRVEARNFTDPTSAGVFTWKDARQNVSVRAGIDKTLTFKLKKQYLKGFLDIKCAIIGMSGAYCVPFIDGSGQPAIAAGTSAQYILAPGSHNIVVLPGQAGSWSPASISKTVRIRAGATQTIDVSFTVVQPSPTPEPSAVPADTNRSPILTMGGCNAEFRGYRWGPANPATFAGYESKTMMTTQWSPPECRPDATDPTHPPRELTPAECAIFYYKPLNLVLFPNRPFNGDAYYNDVALLIRHVESYEDELGLSRSKKVVLGPVSYEGGGVIGSPDAVMVSGASVVDLPDIIEKTRATTGFMAAMDNTHLAISPYFFGIVDTVVRKALGGASSVYTIEPSEIPPYVPQ